MSPSWTTPAELLQIPVISSYWLAQGAPILELPYIISTVSTTASACSQETINQPQYFATSSSEKQSKNSVLVGK